MNDDDFREVVEELKNPVVRVWLFFCLLFIILLWW